MTTSIGVQGASGGVGASCLVGALAVRAAQSGRSVVCLDHRATSGGLDVVLGVEQRPGLRWPDLRRARGVLEGHELLPALPGRRGVRVVASDRRHPRAVPLAAVDAVRRGLDGCADLLVHDLPGPEVPGWPTLVRDLDVVVLLVGAQAAQVAAGAAVGLLLDETGVQARLAVRAAGGDVAAAVAEALGRPLAVRVGADRGLAGCAARGAPPGSSRGPLRDAADELLAGALAGRSAA